MQEELFIGKEMRRYVRINTKLTVRLKTSDGSIGSIYVGTSNNISEGGLSMKIEDNVDELLNKLTIENFGFNVSIQLLNPEEEVEIDAVSKWTNSRIEWVKMPPHKHEVLYIGLAFRDVPETTRELIQHHIENKTKKKSDNSASTESRQ